MDTAAEALVRESPPVPPLPEAARAMPPAGAVMATPAGEALLVRESRPVPEESRVRVAAPREREAEAEAMATSSPAAAARVPEEYRDRAAAEPGLASA